jgi:cytochrome c oxidase assembly protein subunit 15
VPRGSARAGFIRTVFSRFLPRKEFLSRMRLELIAGYAFHVGLFALLFFAAPHIEFYKTTILGFGWTAMPYWAFILASELAFAGLLILWLAVMAWRRRNVAGQAVLLPSLLLGLVIFQALLGMWTVTLLLYPAIVTSHLLFGLATLSLLWWLSSRGLGLYGGGADGGDRGLRPLALLGLLLVIGQIALGGWTSSNYAALACPDFPTCQGAWWPTMDFGEGFRIGHEVGVDYEGGVLDGPARTAIHLLHRLGALLVFLLLAAIAVLTLVKAGTRRVRRIAVLVLGLLSLQVGLGIANVLAGLPLPIAVAHNGVAALLLLSVVSLNLALIPRNDPDSIY